VASIRFDSLPSLMMLATVVPDGFAPLRWLSGVVARKNAVRI